MSNIKLFPKGDSDPNAVLDAAKNWDLKEFMIIGWDEKGHLVIGGTTEDPRKQSWLLQNADHWLWDIDD